MMRDNITSFGHSYGNVSVIVIAAIRITYLSHIRVAGGDRGGRGRWYVWGGRCSKKILSWVAARGKINQ